MKCRTCGAIIQNVSREYPSEMDCQKCYLRTMKYTVHTIGASHNKRPQGSKPPPGVSFRRIDEISKVRNG